MKKFLMAAMLTLGLIICQATQVEASEVYCFSETRGGKIADNYVVKESVQRTSYGIKVTLHTYTKSNQGSRDRYWEVGFTRRGDDYYMIWLPTEYETLIASGNRVIKPDFVKILNVALS